MIQRKVESTDKAIDSYLASGRYGFTIDYPHLTKERGEYATDKKSIHCCNGL